MPNGERAGPLSHVKVLELGSFIAGPFCGQILADLGAEVIKIEPPGTGDALRRWGAAKTPSGRSLWWSVLGRNKLSLTLDLRNPASRQVVRRLVRQTDVLVENFRPGTMERWGLGPEELQRERPELIVARVSGFGQSGPYSPRAGFAAVAEAMAGLRHLTGYPDRVPTRVGVSIGDSLAGMQACIGVLAALEARRSRTGRGQIVDVSIAESVLAILESVVAEHAATGAVRGRTGSILPGIAPSNVYPTADGELVVVAANADGLFRRLAAAMGNPALADDPRYATHEARGHNQSALDDLIAAWTRTKVADDLLDAMERAGIPAGPVNDAAALVRDPHFRARDAIVEMPDAEIGTITMQGVFPKFSETPGAVHWTGPPLGEHTDRILTERLGMTPDEVDRLRAEGVV